MLNRRPMVEFDPIIIDAGSASKGTPLNMIHPMRAPSGIIGDAAVANTETFLTSELEKFDPVIREPLSGFTYYNDIAIDVSQNPDWNQVISYKSVDYRISNGSHEGPVQGGMATEIPVVQAQPFKDYFQSHRWSATFRINYYELVSNQITDWSLQDSLRRGLRLFYDQHLENHTYLGMPQYNTFGLLNQPGVTPTTLPNGANGSSEWANKTPQEILRDLAFMLEESWYATSLSVYGRPNHISLPFNLYAMLVADGSSELMANSTWKWFLENNIVAANGGTLKITFNKFGATAGAGGTSRIAVYNDDPNILRLEILVPLTRIMFDSNTEKVCYDSLYSSSISEVMLFYPDTMRYYDGA